MKVTFAGGGTGGHLYPAIAIADALIERGKQRAHRVDVQFIGARDRLESRIVPAAGYPLHFVASASLSRRRPLDFLRASFINGAGVFSAMVLLLTHRPILLIASGGYVCFPVVVAARMLRTLRLVSCPIVLLEINARPGLTNRTLAPLVDEVWGALDVPSPEFTGRYYATGVPIRRSLENLPQRDVAAQRLSLDPAKHTLLIMGGSQGARSINDAIVALVESGNFPPEWQPLHLTGETDFERVAAAYQSRHVAGKVLPFLDDPADAYACADAAITRAGAATLAELAAVGLPAILIAYPHAAEDHQRINAERFANAGAAYLIGDQVLSAETLLQALRETLEPAARRRMAEAIKRLAKPDAMENIIDRVRALTGAP